MLRVLPSSGFAIQYEKTSQPPEIPSGNQRSMGSEPTDSPRWPTRLVTDLSQSWHQQLAAFLLEQGAELNPDGWAPLHYAAFEGRAQMITFLIGKGARKDAPAPNEFTALMLAHSPKEPAHA